MVYLLGKSGLVNVFIGSGKIYFLLVLILLEYLCESEKKSKGICVIWIIFIRVLIKEI